MQLVQWVPLMRAFLETSRVITRVRECQADGPVKPWLQKHRVIHGLRDDNMPTERRAKVVCYNTCGRRHPMVGLAFLGA